MTAYVHQARPHQPDKYATLLAEQARIEAETRLYETVAVQKRRLADLQETFRENRDTPHTAEQIWQAAIIRNGDSPEVCKQRLNEAEADAARWVDPRGKAEA